MVSGSLPYLTQDEVNCEYYKKEFKCLELGYGVRKWEDCPNQT